MEPKWLILQEAAGTSVQWLLPHRSMSPDLPDLPVFTEKLETQICMGNFSTPKCWQLIQHLLKPRLAHTMTTSLWIYDALPHKIRWTSTKKGHPTGQLICWNVKLLVYRPMHFQSSVLYGTKHCRHSTAERGQQWDPPTPPNQATLGPNTKECGLIFLFSLSPALIAEMLFGWRGRGGGSQSLCYLA